MNNDENIKKIAGAELNEMLGMFNRTAMQEQRNAAVQMYKVYKDFCDAGFTEEQALRLVENLMTAAITKAGKGNEE